MKYILSNFYNNYKNVQKIIEDYFYDKDIIGLQGHFSFNICYGSYNNIDSEQLCLYSDIEQVLQDYGSLSKFLMLDFGNIMLKESDYLDSFSRIILETFVDNKEVFFEVADEKFIKYLINKYPNIQIILHQNYTFFHSEEEIKKIIDLYPNNIKGIICNKDHSFMNISIKKYYLFSINNCYSCKYINRCIKQENENILDYSENSVFGNCKFVSYKHEKQIKEEIQELIESEENYEAILLDTIIIKYQELEMPLIEMTLKGEDVLNEDN